jgi:hypothetical protein
VTLKAFVGGDALYGEIYSPYGPFYHEAFGAFFALTGIEVTTNASRLIVVVLWVATSLLFGVAAQRLSGSVILGVTGGIAAFATLHVLTAEPMHPQVLCVVLLGLFTLLAVIGPTQRVARLGAACGALLAMLILTKVNLGAYAVAAIALAAVLTVEPLQRRRWIRWPVIAAFLALPVVLMARDLNEDWVRDLVALEVLAATAVIVAARPLQPGRGEDSIVVVRWLLAAAASFVIAFVAIVVAIVIAGSTPADVWDGVVVQAMRVREVMTSSFPLSQDAVSWGIAAVAGAALAVLLRREEGAGPPTIFPGILRAAAGLAIWYTVAEAAPLSLNPPAGNPDALPLVLAWVAAIPPAEVHEPPYRRFLRVLLPAIAVAQTLQVYPVAGSQQWIAALTFVPVGALCLGDAMASLRAWAGQRGPLATRRLGLVVTVVTVALAAQFALDSLARPGTSNLVAYRNQPALPFDGAGLLHLPQEQADAYIRLVDLLHRHRCTAFIGYSNVNSLYLWSGIEPPRPQPPGAWVTALDAERQQQAVDDLRDSPRQCAIRSETVANAWLHGEPPEPRPLVRYVFDEFRSVERVADFSFLLPTDTAGAPSRR